MKVLIVEDDPAEIRVLRLVLEGLGHSVVAAESGEEALKSLGVEQPDVMLLDLDLGPGIDGFEVARRKMQDDSISAIPVIITTGLATSTISRRDEPVHPLAGALITLAKPIDVQQLEKALRFLEAHR